MKTVTVSRKILTGLLSLCLLVSHVPVVYGEDAVAISEKGERFSSIDIQKQIVQIQEELEKQRSILIQTKNELLEAERNSRSSDGRTIVEMHSLLRWITSIAAVGSLAIFLMDDVRMSQVWRSLDKVTLGYDDKNMARAKALISNNTESFLDKIFSGWRCVAIRYSLPVVMAGVHVASYFVYQPTQATQIKISIEDEEMNELKRRIEVLEYAIDALTESLKSKHDLEKKTKVEREKEQVKN